MRKILSLSQVPESILVIATRRIGDVILTTPLIRSLRNAYPDSRLDVVIFKGTEGGLSSNGDIDNIIVIGEGATFREQVKTVCRLFRRYDLAISTLSGDRPTFYAFIAGRKSIGFLEKTNRYSWHTLLLDGHVLFDNLDTHTVTMNLSVLDLLGIRKIPDVVVSWGEDDETKARDLLPFDIESEPYAVLHVYPKFPYKMWRSEGWMALVHWLNAGGFRVVFTGGDSPGEGEYISVLARSLNDGCVNVAGELGLGGVGYLLSRAALYVGLDTAVTHMASALGIPTVALYGPTNPVKWGPMPRGFSFPGTSPYERRGSQRKGNVFLLQGKGECVPCHEEGCDRNINSLSQCLQEISAADVIEAVKTVLKQET